MTTLDTHETKSVPPSLNRPASPVRMMLFSAAVMGLALVGITIPEAARPAIFWLLVVSVPVSVIIGVYRERIHPRQWMKALARWRYWHLVQRGGVLGALVCMMLAAFAFRPTDKPALEPGIYWAVLGMVCMGVALLANALTRYIPPVETPPLYERLERLRAAVVAGQPVLRRALHTIWQAEDAVRPIRWRAVAVGLLLVACVLQANIFTPDTVLPWFSGLLTLSHHLQMLMLISGTMLVTWGMMGKQPHPPALSSGGEGERETITVGIWRAMPLRQLLSMMRANFAAYARQVPAHRWALLAILAVAVFARFWDLELWTTRFLDELHYMSAIVRLRDTPSQQILAPFSPVTAFTWVFPYGQYLTTLITGANFTGVRVMSALFGVAQVGAVYFLGKQVFNRRVALVAAAVLATLPAHIHFSRIGIGNIADPLPGILALGFLARGIKSGQQRDFALAGFWLGWTQYFYEGGRLFYPPFVVAWLGWLLLFMRRGNGAQFPKVRNLLVMLLTAAVLIIPVWETLAARAIQIAPRFDAMRDADQRELLLSPYTTWQERLEPIIRKIHLPVLALVQTPDESWFFGGKQPFVLTLLVPFFLLGMAQCLWRLRTAGGSLVVWWIFSACVGIALISDSLSSPRYLVMLPALALAIGVGVVGLVDYLTLQPSLQEERARKDGAWHAMPLQRRVLFAIGAFILLFQGGYYALIHMPDFYLDRFYPVMDRNGRHVSDTDDALLRTTALPPNTDVFVLSRELIWDFNMNTVPEYWNRPDIHIRHMFLKHFTNKFIRELPHDRNYAFFLEDDDVRTLKRLDWFFDFVPDPTGNNGLSPYRIPQDVQMRLYFAPAAEAPKE